MNLNEPIIVQPDPIKKRDGSYKTLLPIRLESLKFIILDDNNKKECAVRISPFPLPLVLWSGDEYDLVGDYTQEQVESRIMEKLGNDPISVLKNLMPNYEIIVK